MSPPSLVPTPELVRRNAKIVWAALNLGVLVFSVMQLVFVQVPRRNEPDLPAFIFIPWIFMFSVIPMGLFIRGQVFKRNWEGDVVLPKGYMTGNIIAWACCEGVAFISVIFGTYLAESIWTFIPGAISFLVLLLLYPNGKAMFPPAGDNPYQQRR